MDGLGGVEAGVCDTGNEAEGGSRASAAVLDAEFGGGDNVLGFGYCFDLGDDDAGACVEGVADGGVIVAGDAGMGEQGMEGGKVGIGILPDKGDTSAFTHEYDFVNHLDGLISKVKVREGRCVIDVP